VRKLFVVSLLLLAISAGCKCGDGVVETPKYGNVEVFLYETQPPQTFIASWSHLIYDEGILRVYDRPASSMDRSHIISYRGDFLIKLQQDAESR